MERAPICDQSMRRSYQGTFKSLIPVKFRMVPTFVIFLLFYCPNNFEQLGSTKPSALVLGADRGAHHRRQMLLAHSRIFALRPHCSSLASSASSISTTITPSVDFTMCH